MQKVNWFRSSGVRIVTHLKDFREDFFLWYKEMKKLPIINWTCNGNKSTTKNRSDILLILAALIRLINSIHFVQVDYLKPQITIWFRTNIDKKTLSILTLTRASQKEQFKNLHFAITVVQTMKNVSPILCMKMRWE